MAHEAGTEQHAGLTRGVKEVACRYGMTGAVAQQMVSGGVEVMIGATLDPTLGHVVLFGAGGTMVELLNDVAFRIHPLTTLDATDMTEEVRCSKLLRGFRGALLHISTALTLCPEIRELDINPLKAMAQGAVAVDARVKKIVPEPPSRRGAY